MSDRQHTEEDPGKATSPPQSRSWHKSWFIVNLGLPVAWMAACAASSAVMIGTSRAPGLVISMILGWTVTLIGLSIYLNIRICRAHAKGKPWLLALLVTGSTCLCLSLSFAGCISLLSGIRF